MRNANSENQKYGIHTKYLTQDVFDLCSRVDGRGTNFYNMYLLNTNNINEKLKLLSYQ